MNALRLLDAVLACLIVAVLVVVPGVLPILI